jgi:4-amino-4-deoxy-L-arabinose transferase-like glycosyltransferase
MPAENSAGCTGSTWQRLRRILLIAAMAGAAFFGFLGAIDVWGKREQRAAAEAIDTVDHNHWLVAQIQGRPRLEKPPLPRWLIAGLMHVSGRRDEWMVRLPGALAGLATVAVVFALGRRMGGPTAGLASALVLCSLGFFVGEMRQASNDAPLALFTTLAIYSVWRVIHDQDSSEAFRPFGLRPWRLVFYVALGLGFLAKGPVILLLVSVTVIPFLAFSGRLVWGLRRLADGWGILIFAALALSWPLAVLSRDPGAMRVWVLEMTEKTGLSRILEHRKHALLLREWPSMVLPWPFLAVVGAALPFLLNFWKPARPWSPLSSADARAGDLAAAPLWFCWWWGIGNLVMFCFWAVAKPNYYLPCLPGMALLIGFAWISTAKAARGSGLAAQASRLVLQAQWVFLLVAAALTPLLARQWVPIAVRPWLAAMAFAMLAGVAWSAIAWRRGSDAQSLGAIATPAVLCILIAYGKVAPAENARHSHRAFAEKLTSLVPPGTRAVMFFNEIDEGLWFYLRGLELRPVPEGLPRRNSAYDLAESYRSRLHTEESLREIEARRRNRDHQAFLAWLEHHDPTMPYVLIRKSLYERYETDLSGLVRPVYRETGLKRNELILLEAAGADPLLSSQATDLPARR